MDTDYIPRLVDLSLTELMSELPAIAIDGPKAVGKTATASRRARTVLALDDPVVAESVHNEPRRLAEEERPILLDEWQKLPEVWDHVRRAVDAGAPAGSYLLTGSAVPPDARVHSGAGRIVHVRMRPLSLAERWRGEQTVSLATLMEGGDTSIEGVTGRSLRDYATEITASGFPGLRSLTPQARHLQLRGYVDNVVQRDFPQQGMRVRRPNTLLRWLRAYAAASATTASYNAILDASTPGEGTKPAATTTIAYRDALESLWLLDEMAPWSPGDASLHRLTQTPKHFLADPALAAVLLDITAEDLVSGVHETRFGARYGSIAGRLFEALMALSLRTYAESARASIGFLRTRGGDHEVDFVVQNGRSVVAIEVKLSPTITDADVRHLVWMRNRLGGDLADAVIITTGSRAYRRLGDGIAVVPAALLGA